MTDLKTVSAKIPTYVYEEMVLRVPQGDRSDFIRDAIAEKLQQTPKPDRILNFEERVQKVEEELGQIKKYLSDLDMLTFNRGDVDPHSFGVDEIDHKIIDYLVHYKGATTPELAEYLKTNRWLVLNRLRRLHKNSKKTGKPIVTYFSGEKSGKKKAWWINEETVEE